MLRPALRRVCGILLGGAVGLAAASASLTPQEQHDLGGHAELPCPVPRYDAVFRARRNMWHLLTPRDLVPLYAHQPSRQLAISICAARVSKDEIATMLASSSRDDRLFGLAVAGHPSYMGQRDDV